MKRISWNKELEVAHEYDIAVIGGGIAGVCAALAAAKQNAKVILVERFAVTGGNATAGGVANWSGETKGQGVIFDEIIANQEAFHSIAPYPGPYKHFEPSSNRIFDHEILAVILQEMLIKYNVKLLLHTQFVDTICNNRKIEYAVISGNSGPELIRADVFIDCTGGGLVANQSQCRCLEQKAGTQLPASIMFFIHETCEKNFTPQLPEGWLKPVTKENDLPMTTFWPDGPDGQALKVKIPGGDSNSTEGMTEIEIRARRRMLEVLDYFQRQEKRKLRFGHAPAITGLREGRRILGDYVLRLEDVRQKKIHEDAVAKGYFYLDGMKPDDEKRTYILTKEEQRIPPYHIPLRSLIAKDSDNLLMAGRCFSADQLVLSSARVMTTCAMMGQAVGTTAALAADSRQLVRNLDYGRIRRILEQNGADLAI